MKKIFILAVVVIFTVMAFGCKKKYSSRYPAEEMASGKITVVGQSNLTIESAIGKQFELSEISNMKRWRKRANKYKKCRIEIVVFYTETYSEQGIVINTTIDSLAKE